MISSILSCAFLLGTVLASPRHTDPYIAAGQHVIYSYKGLTPPDDLVASVQAGHVAGVILFTENIDQTNINNTADQVARLQRVYAQSPAYNGHPLFIMTDQEGGQVRRISKGGPVQSAKEMGAAKDPAAAGAEGGRSSAKSLRSGGLNVNLAPVLDVFDVEGNFIDEYERSFGNTSALVAKTAAPFIRESQRLGVLTAGKHFPGLGTAPRGSNTDEGVVVLDASLDRLRSVDEAVYASKAIQDVDLAMVMTSWAVYTNFDADHPAGLSSKWIRDELRSRLGFKDTVVVTDAIEAGSVRPYGDLSTITLLAKHAGVDLILCSARNATQGKVATEAIANALRNGSLPWDDFSASTSRIEAARAKLTF